MSVQVRGLVEIGREQGGEEKTTEEQAVSVRLHVGSGTVYLDPADGWRNVMPSGYGVFLASERPDLVEKWRTTDDAYYARHDRTADSLRDGPVTTEELCDVYGSFERLPCGLEQADEILARQVFEHLSIKEARLALDECDRVLKPDGVLRLDVPDHEETLRRYRLTGDPFFVRHVLGSKRNEAAYHVMAYTREALRALVEEHGFDFEAEEPSPNVAPSFCLRFRKPGPRAAWQYVPQDLLAVPDEAFVVEFGPGTRPWPRSDVLIDRDRAFLDSATEVNLVGRRIEKVAADLDLALKGGDRLPWATGRFDFLFASHVLEHVRNPGTVAQEFARIAKRGLIVVPSILKEGLTAFEEGSHMWWSLPPREGSKALRMIRANYEWRSKIADPDASGCLSRIFRTGPFRLDHDARVLRKWWRRVEPALDVVHAWQGTLEVECL